jgi:Xaa-Pro aminopeptidase
MTNTSRPIIANVPRLNEFMDRHRLAAVVVRSGQNFTYLAGFAYPGTLARHLDLPDSVRGVLLLWPRHGEPVIVLNKIAEGLTKRDSWVKRVEMYEILLEDSMVLALEPHKDHFHIQDMVVVRAAGPQLISDKFSTDQMFVIE